MTFRSFSWLAVVVFAGSAHVATAGDPVAPDFDRCIARCRELVAGEQCSAGEASWRKLFTDFPNDSRVRARLREIEDGLKVCLFRRSLPPIKGEDLFGSSVKRFSPSTREVEFAFRGTEAPLWTTVEHGIRILDVRLEGSLTFEASMSYIDSSRHVAAVFLCYDIEKRGGYLVQPGYFRDNGTSTLSAPPGIRRIGTFGDDDIVNKASGYGDYDGPLKITRSGGEIVATVGGKCVVRASDNKFTTGYLAVQAGNVASISIKGRIDRHAYRKLIAERFATQFGKWVESSYAREKEIPEWAREAVVASPDMTLTELPADAPTEDRTSLTDAIELAADGDPEGAVSAVALALAAPPHTALYLRAVGDIALHRYKSACEALDQLAAEEPEFVPARLFRGVARFGMRQTEEAKADLAWALERRPRASIALVTSAIVAMFEGELSRADAVLATADERGVVGEDVDEVRDWVHRARKGPNFAQRFEHASDHFVVVSDHSKKVCFDAATLLESMQLQYAGALGPAPTRDRSGKARVYVFSGPEGYFDYAEDLQVRADSSAGVYLPMLRELVIWIPLDMTDFNDTVRHEGFHQFLHRLVEEAPIWFNEGYASVMGGGGPEGVRNGKRDAEFVKGFVPVRKLVAMRQPEFMKIAGITYTESRYLVDHLRRTKNAKLKTVLRDYFTAIAGGLSQDEANAKVLDPVMDVLEAEFKAGL